MIRFLILCLALLTACDSQLEVELPEQRPRLVVRSLFAADSLITLSIGQSGALLDPGGVPLDDVTTATVRLYEDDALVGEATYARNRLRYLSDVRAAPGRRYRVEVEAPGFDPVYAEDTVPEPIPFELDLEAGPEPETSDRNRLDTLTLRFTDPDGLDSYALYGLLEQRFTNGTVQLGSLSFRSTDPLLRDGDFTDLITDFEDSTFRRAIFQSRPVEGQSVAIQLRVFRFAGDATVEYAERIRLARLSDMYYAYVRALETEGTEPPFDTPQALPSNVSGGYGIFAAFAASEHILAQGDVPQRIRSAAGG